MRRLKISPPHESLDHCDIRFWIYIQQFTDLFCLMIKNERQERADLFIRMLPIEYVTNRHLDIHWEGENSDFNEFMPHLRRANSFFQPRILTLLNTSLILNKNTRILTFLMGAEEVHLINVKIHLSSNETNYQRSLKRLVIDRVEESVNFVQGLGEAECLVLKDSILKLTQNKAFVPREHATIFKMMNMRYRYQIHEQPQILSLAKLKDLMGHDSSIIEELSLSVMGENPATYSEFLTSGLPKL